MKDDLTAIPKGAKPVRLSSATIRLTMAEAKIVLDWRARLDPKSEKHWSQADSALMDKLLDFVDD